jgi:BirA family biotin operon repressor/biotin-[acetyl-CoA-carboxylase] ligase
MTLFIKKTIKKKTCRSIIDVKIEIDKIDYAIIGIGINVNNEISSLVPEAISLKEILKKLKRKDIIKELIKEFKDSLKMEIIKILNLWKDKSLTLERKVKVIHPEGEKNGFSFRCF